MHLSNKLHRALDRLIRSPLLRGAVESQAKRVFLANRSQNLFFGVYETWAEAEQAAASYGVAGYDNPESAKMYLARLRIDQHDYPALYWIARSLQDGFRTVFDVGGSTGIKYYAFKDLLANWPDVKWTVQDVPAMVQKGREVAGNMDRPPPLFFTDRFEDGDGSDLLYASGVLQYLPRTLGEMLQGYSRLPRRILINTAAIHADAEYFTVNSIGTAFCPYRVQTQANLIRGLSKLGYKLHEAWINSDKPLTIPSRPDRSLTHYSGFLLDLHN